MKKSILLAITATVLVLLMTCMAMSSFCLMTAAGNASKAVTSPM